jgi:ATP-dependent Lon protease
VTLSGRILPVGGIREKLLAAKTAGLSTVIFPSKNSPDLVSIHEDLKSGIRIRTVEDITEVLDLALVHA